MLHQHLLSAAVSACLTSPLLHARLRGILAHGTELTALSVQRAFHGECQDILSDALDREEPRRFRVDDIGHVVRVLWPTTMFVGQAGATIPFFDTLAALLFERTGTVLHFRADALDDYTRLSARIDPTLLLCWKIGRDIGRNHLVTQQDVTDAVMSVQPFCTPEADSARVHTDNHVHFGGASSEQLILMAALRGSAASMDSGEERGESQLKLVEQLAHALLGCGDTLNAASEAEITELSQRLLTLRRHMQPVGRINWTNLCKSTAGETTPSSRWIKHRLASCMCAQDLGQAWLWLLLWCARLYQDRACGPKRRIALFLLLGSIMRVRQGMLVDGYGLNRFLDASKNRIASKDIADALGRDAVRRIFHGKQDRAEIKISHGMLNDTKVRALLRGVHGSSPPAAGAAPIGTDEACARWHYCVHFSRSHASPWKDADKIKDLLTSRAQWKGNPLLAATSWVDGLTLNPARMIRTLDVAGDENASKTEVFAPALRWLRSLRRPEGEGKPLRLSIHAGEDYAHPLSGMRHLDETIVFSDMQEGDRIGHGLALGIRPGDWFVEHGQALVSVDEQVDNLVWAWHFATAHPRLPHAALMADLYTRAVLAYAPHVAWLNSPVPHAGPIDMQELYVAWTLRRNCRQLALKPSPVNPKVPVAVPDWKDLARDDSAASAAVRLFRKRAKSFGLQKLDKFTAQQRRKPYFVQQTCSDRQALPLPLPVLHHDLSLFTSVASPLETEFMEALQDLLIERYRRRGIIFEVNPTSNRHIGSFSHLKDHPIFRWDPPDPALLAAGADMNRFSLREGALQVCVNTDDPGVMPTTLRTEFILLGSAALDRRCAQHHVDAWLERLREQGNALFDDCHPA